MIDTKHNFKNKYKDTKCRLCGLHEETQDHILFECTKNGIKPQNRFTKKDVFNDKNISKLKSIAKTIDEVMKLLEAVDTEENEGNEEQKKETEV